MANRETFFFKETLKIERLNGEFDNAEDAIWNVVADQGLYGLISGGALSAPTTTGTPEVTAAGFLGIDKNGRRLTLASPLVVDLTNDYTGTAVAPSSGNFKWLALVARYGKLGSASVFDGDGATIYTVETEGISSTGDVTVDSGSANFGQLRVIQGTQAGSAGAANRPAVPSPDIIVGDVLIDSTGFVVGGASGISMARTDRIASRLTGGSQTLNFDAGQYVLLEEHLFDSAGVFARRYVGRHYTSGPPIPGSAVRTINAKWDGVNQLWVSDDASKEASLIEESTGTVTFNARTAGGSSWTDTRHDPGGWDARITFQMNATANADLTIDSTGLVTGIGPQTAFASVQFYVMSGYPTSGPNSDVSAGFTWPQGFVSRPSSITLADFGSFNVNLGTLAVTAEPAGGFLFGSINSVSTPIQIGLFQSITATL